MKNHRNKRIMLLCAVTLGGLLAATPATAGESLVWNQLHLMGASGVPGEPDHKYVFKGQLSIRSTSSSTGFSLSKGIYSTSRTSTATFWVEGVGRWDASRSEASESLIFQGDVQGNFRSVLKCNGDPWLSRQPCAVIATYYNSEQSKVRDWPGLVKQWRLPLTVEVVTLEAATRLSREATAKAPPPPPPPPAAPEESLSAPPGGASRALNQSTLAVKPARSLAQQSTRPESAAIATPSAPQARLEIVAATAQVLANCAGPKPAATVRVELRNSGLPLAANKGTIYAKEIGGATGLGSAGLHLPAVGPGETRSVDIPVITHQSYTALGGSHQLGIYLNPLVANGQPSFRKPDKPHTVTLVVPADHCRPQIKAPVTGGQILTPEETRGLRPQPEPPGRVLTPLTR
jgi:hypothetical protein